MNVPSINRRFDIHRAINWNDLLILLAIAALFYGLLDFIHEWEGLLRPEVEIDLSPWALPKYTFFSLIRGFSAYSLSLLFTLVYGYIAAYNRKAEKIMLPILDILQSIPVLGFLPGFVLGLVFLFPHSNIGLELAAVLMIFTAQAWNMTFSFYNSIRTTPKELLEAARICRLNSWYKFIKVELPYSAIGLAWNSMMSMAGGWFFLMVNEAFVLGKRDFRLPGIGSYMSVALEKGNISAMVSAIAAMVLMIVLVDQVFWRPIVVWVEKFKVEETLVSRSKRSFILDLIQRSHILRFARQTIWQPIFYTVSVNYAHGIAVIEERHLIQISDDYKRLARAGGRIFFKALAVFILLFLAWKLFSLLSEVSLTEWLTILWSLMLTFLRVIIAVTVGTILMVPIGVAIGLNPRFSRLLQPVVQIAASFPAPMLFPLVIIALSKIKIGIEFGAIVLMMLGTMWYILFNVIAGVAAIPEDLREAATFARLDRWQVWKRLILPGIFPGLVTGWVTATGGAWNASIVAEYIHFGNSQLIATGLGSLITTATDNGQFDLLAASVTIMALTVVLINRVFWQRLYTISEERFSLNK